MRVRDLFEIRRGHNLDLNGLTRSLDDDAVNYVSNSGRNNGVSARVAPVTGIAPADAGTITISLAGSALETFLQPASFYASQNISILTAKRAMTEHEKLWWVLCIRTNIFRYGFGRKANITHGDLELPDEMPGWCKDVSVPDFTAMRAPASNSGAPSLDPSGWRSFRYGDLFNFERGERVINRELRPGTTAYVRASERRNGIVAFGDLPLRHTAGSITVPYNGNSVGKAFYQPRPFFASDDVIVLVPKRPLTPAAAHFVCALIRAERFRFSYGRKWNMERMRRAVMRLPTTPDGEPDWAFMERFVLSLPYSSSIGG